MGGWVKRVFPFLSSHFWRKKFLKKSEARQKRAERKAEAAAAIPFPLKPPFPRRSRRS